MEKCQPENAFPSSKRAMATQPFMRHLPPKLVQDLGASVDHRLNQLQTRSGLYRDRAVPQRGLIRPNIVLPL